MVKIRFNLIVIILLFFSGVPLYAFELPSIDVQKRVLDNGFTLLTKKDPSSSMVALGLLVGAGGRTEEDLLGTGVSHLIEHLIFKGSHQNTSSEIAKKIEGLGGKMNAYTTPDFTLYYVEIPREYIRVGLDVLTESLLNPAFRDEDIKKEKEVVVHEFQMRQDDPDRLLSNMLWKNLFRVHPYRVKTIGNPELIHSLTRVDIIQYYERWYVPSNMTLIMVGNFDQNNLDIESHLKKFQAKPFRTVVTNSETIRAFPRQVIDYKSVKLTRLKIGYIIPTMAHPDLPALDVLSSILGDGRKSRYYERLRDREGVVHSISSWVLALHDAGVFGIEATLADEPPQKVINRILSEVSQIQEEGVREEEVQRAISKILMSYVNALDSISSQLWWIASTHHMTDSTEFLKSYYNRLLEVTDEDIQRVAIKYLQYETVVLLLPEDQKKKEEIKDHHQKNLAVETLKLDNGLQFVIGPDHDLPVVIIKAFFLGGLSAENQESNGLFYLLSKMPVKDPDLTEAIERVGGSLSGSSGYNTFGYTIVVPSDAFVGAVDALVSLLLDPYFKEEALLREKEGALARIQAVYDAPVQMGGWLVRQKLYPHHPYGFLTSGTSKSISAINLDDLIKTFKKYAVAKNGVVGIFGDIDPKEVSLLLREKFESLEKGYRQPFSLPEINLSSEGKLYHEERDQAQSVVLLGYHGVRVTDDDRYSLELLSSVLSGFGSPLFEKIRNELGAVYYIGATNIFGLDPGAFVIYAGTTPDKENLVLEQIENILNQIRTTLVDEDTLNWAKQKYLGQVYRSRDKLRARTQAWLLSVLFEIPYYDDRAIRELIENISAEDLMKTAQKYLKLEGAVKLILSPKRVNKEESKNGKTRA